MGNKAQANTSGELSSSRGICGHYYIEDHGNENDSKYYCLQCESYILDQQRIKKEDKLKHELGKEVSSAVDLVYRGVSIQWLIDFAQKYNCWDWPTWKVRRDIVQHETAASRCRYVDLEHVKNTAGVGTPTTFVSHCWGACFGDLVAALCDGDADLSRRVWIDIFAIRQWPSSSPDLDYEFVIKYCPSFILVCSSIPEIVYIDLTKLSSRDPSVISMETKRKLSLFRKWCLIELFVALSMEGKSVVVKGGCHSMNKVSQKVEFTSHVDMLWNLSLFIDIEKAAMTLERDERREIIKLKTKFNFNNEEIDSNTYAAANQLVRRAIADGAKAASNPPFQCAACGDKAQLEKLYQNKEVNLRLASACGYLNVVEALVSRGANVDSAGEMGKTAAMCAAEGGHLQILKYLDKHGADLHAADSLGMTALMIGVENGHFDVVKYLSVQEGANVLTCNKYGTSLILAAENGYLEIVKFLVSIGANVHLINRNHSTALMAAAERGYLDIAIYLVDHGADINAVNKLGRAALMRAAAAGQLDVCHALVERGADLTLFDNQRQTAISLAGAAQHMHVVDYLVSMIPDPPTTTTSAKTSKKT